MTLPPTASPAAVHVQLLCAGRRHRAVACSSSAAAAGVTGARMMQGARARAEARPVGQWHTIVETKLRVTTQDRTHRLLDDWVCDDLRVHEGRVAARPELQVAVPEVAARVAPNSPGR